MYYIKINIQHNTWTEGRTFRYATACKYKRALARMRSEGTDVWLHGAVRPRLVLDYSKIEDVKLDGINMGDYPDFCDAYIASATYKGRDMSGRELDALNDDSDFVYEAVLRRVY